MRAVRERTIKSNAFDCISVDEVFGMAHMSNSIAGRSTDKTKRNVHTSKESPHARQYPKSQHGGRIFQSPFVSVELF